VIVIAPAPVWKRGLAAVLDLATLFFGVGWLIAKATGETTGNGFMLAGAPAFALFAIIVAYFIIGRRFAGGTIWDRIFGIGRPQPY
jgi:LPXTG-motif cell wall-anchored protein